MTKLAQYLTEKKVAIPMINDSTATEYWSCNRVAPYSVDSIYAEPPRALSEKVGTSSMQ